MCAELMQMPEANLKRTLLVVDDDPSMLRLVKLVFRNDFKQILSSDEPPEGLRLAMTYKPALILLDNDMPGMTGVEMLKQLKTMPATQSIPVIMLTGNNHEATVKTALGYQVAAYLLKPCDPETLFQTVIQVLES
jgi:CheY-like chemotaxis protein